MSTTIKLKYKNWDKHILPKILEQQHIHRNQGIPATIRGLLYIFEGTILEKKDYGSLSKHLVKWRENGDIEGDWIVDKSRRIIDITDYKQQGRSILKVFDENIQTLKDFITPSERIQDCIDYLRNIITDIHDHIPKWLGQPKYVEVWVEKNAMGSVLSFILKKEGLRVIVAPNGGWSSYTFAKDNLDRLLDIKHNQKKEIYIQYYGDSDPSGERMTADDSKMVSLLKKHGIHFERIAITEKTIKDFGMERLKVIRDPQTYKKLHHKDPNRHWFMARHNGEIWQIEVDALQLDMNKFNRLVVSNVEKHFDKSIYEKIIKQIKEKYSSDNIRDELKKQVKELAVEIGLVCF